MEATYPQLGKPCYVVNSSINKLATIDKSTTAEHMRKSSDTLRCRVWLQRALVELPFSVNIVVFANQPAHQKIAEQAS